MVEYFYTSIASVTLILDSYIINAPRTGRKIKITRDFELRIIKKAISDRYRREKSSTYISAKYSCSVKTVWRVLRRYRYRRSGLGHSVGLRTSP